GQLLRFSNTLMGSREVKTDEEGLASLSVDVVAEPPRLYRVQVRFPGKDPSRAAEAASRLFLWPKESPILITDVDHTISDLTEIKVPYTSIDRTPTLAGAVEALTELSRAYRIVYLSARDEVLYEKTRAWLNEKGFPEGPLFCRDFHIGSRQETFK